MLCCVELSEGIVCYVVLRCLTCVLLQFFGEARKMDQWIDDQAHLLNTYYNRLEVDLGEGERLTREIRVSAAVS